jgi:hypothetical protein
MCHAKKCRTCGKTTWSGCGQHVASVKARVPAGQWCDGHRGETGSSSPQAVGDTLFKRLFGR